MSTAKLPEQSEIVIVSCRVRRNIDYTVDIAIPSDLSPENINTLAKVQIENGFVTHKDASAKVQVDISIISVYAISNSKVQS